MQEDMQKALQTEVEKSRDSSRTNGSKFLVICNAHYNVAGMGDIYMLHIWCMKSTQHSAL